MKRTLLTALLAVFFLFTGCSDDKNTAIPDVGNMIATIDGRSWSSLVASGNEMSERGYNTIVVSGSRLNFQDMSDSELILISLIDISDNAITTGEYEVGINPSSSFLSYMKGMSQENFWAAESGLVEVTEVSADQIKGRFEAVLTRELPGEESEETLVITDGAFNVMITDQEIELPDRPDR